MDVFTKSKEPRRECVSRSSFPMDLCSSISMDSCSSNNAEIRKSKKTKRDSVSASSSINKDLLCSSNNAVTRKSTKTKTDSVSAACLSINKDLLCSSDSQQNMTMFPLMELVLFETGNLISLPFRQVFRYQTVCKHWRQEIAEFLKPRLGCKQIFPRNSGNNLTTTISHTKLPIPEEHWLIISTTKCNEERRSAGFRKCMVYSDREGVVFNSSIVPTSIKDFNKILGWKLARRTDIESIISIKSSNGIMFALVEKISTGQFENFKERRVIVFNCFTGYVKVLPGTHNTRMYPVDRAALRDSGMRIAFHPRDMSRYYILRQFHDRCFRIRNRDAVEVGTINLIYDYAKRSWKYIQYEYFLGSDNDYFKLLQGDFFFYTKFVRKDLGLVLVAYNVEQAFWVSAPNINGDEAFEGEGLFEILAFGKCNGKLLVCCAIKDAHGKYTKFKVGELKFISHTSAVWVEVSCFPFKRSYQYVLDSKYFDAMALVEGNVFCCHFDAVSSKRPFRHPPVLYDMVENRWNTLSMSGPLSFDSLTILRPWKAIQVLPRY